MTAASETALIAPGSSLPTASKSWLPADTPRRILFVGYLCMLVAGVVALQQSLLEAAVLIVCAGIGLYGRGAWQFTLAAWLPIIPLAIVTAVVAAVADSSLSNQPAPELILALGAIVLGFVPASMFRNPFKEEQALDRALATRAELHWRELIASPPKVTEDLDGVRVVRDARLGEISRHFDTDVTASITGVLEHHMRVYGWRIGPIARIGIGGYTEVALAQQGVNRDDLMGDGFVAVLDVDRPGGGTDTIRVVVPSRNGARTQLRSMLAWMQADLRFGSRRLEVLSRHTEELIEGLPSDASYASDQLMALLRQPVESRPLLSVVGMPLGEHALLGGSLQIGDEPPIQLYPTAYVQAVIELLSPAANPAGQARGLTP